MTARGIVERLAAELHALRRDRALVATANTLRGPSRSSREAQARCLAGSA